MFEPNTDYTWAWKTTLSALKPEAWENLTQYHANPEYWYFNSQPLPGPGNQRHDRHRRGRPLASGRPLALRPEVLPRRCVMSFRARGTLPSGIDGKL